MAMLMYPPPLLAGKHLAYPGLPAGFERARKGGPVTWPPVAMDPSEGGGTLSHERAAQPAPALVVDAAPAVRHALEALAGLRMVFFAGLPGMGKSLLTHQLACLAVAAGRTVHLLQWDVARDPFERCAAGRRYPQVDGATHLLIRRAVGRWARAEVAVWAQQHPDAPHLLIGEAPLVGGRLIELTQPAADAAEPLLTDPSCRFVLPVPSAGVRRHVMAERDRRSAAPLHEKERNDAPPHLMREAWADILDLARSNGLPITGDAAASGDYDADTYERVYRWWLRHRPLQVLPLGTVLPTSTMSVYDLHDACLPLLPSEAEADRWVRQVEEEAF